MRIKQKRERDRGMRRRRRRRRIPAESMDNDEGFEEMEDDDVEMTEEEVFEKIKLL